MQTEPISKITNEKKDKAWLQVSIRPDCKNLASGPPSLDSLQADLMTN